MPLPRFTLVTPFRWTATVSGAFVGCMLLMFAVVLWQTTAFLNANFDRLIMDIAHIVRAEMPEDRALTLNSHLGDGPRRVRLGGLFAADSTPLAGNIARLPHGLATDGRPQAVSVENDAGRTIQARAVGYRLSNGETLVIGRDTEEIAEITDIIWRTLAFGLVPALLSALTAGAFLNWRSQKRFAEVNKRIQRIIAGELRERLPARGTQEPVDKFAVIINGMLDEIESLVQSLAGVGDDIAHDLRTPLTRVRISLERARANARSLADLQQSVDQALTELDHAISIITALLRIRQIEQTRRRTGFVDVKMGDLLHEVGDLYEPIADEKQLELSVNADCDLAVRGDRDLLFEAVANLVDNAVKFTPQGGRIELLLSRGQDGDGLMCVKDTGPGVAESERELITQRFYRSDRSRHTTGIGLGLSLVAAIVKLHGFRLNIVPGPGFIAEIHMPLATRIDVSRPVARRS